MEIGVDTTEGYIGVGEDKIFVAVGKVMDESISTLFWALKNFWKKDFCILHVHKPAQMISVMGAKFTVDKLDAQQVRTCREIEKKEMQNNLNEYLDICLHAGVRAETICIEMDNIERGIVELIAQHGIIKLVMGAAADKHYSKHELFNDYIYNHSTFFFSKDQQKILFAAKKMAKLKAKKAIFVCQNAPISCNIWFVCKGHLIVTRSGTKSNMEGVLEKTAIKASSPSSSSALDGPISTTGQPDESINKILIESLNHHVVPPPQSEHFGPKVLAKSQSYAVNLTNPVQDFFLRAMSCSSETSRRSTIAASSSSSGRTAGIRTPWSVNDSSPAGELAKKSDSLFEKKKKGKKEQLETERQQLEKSKSQQYQIMEEPRIAHDQKIMLEIVDSARTMAKLGEKEVLSAAQQLGAIQKELDDELQLRKKREEEIAGLQRPQFFSVFSALEIESATECFNPSMMIGEGGYGNVYKGLLRQTPVAIKKFHCHSLEGQSSSDFQREVDVLSKVRHPNLVTLIGTCPEASSLVYEYLPNGDLEDRLTCKHGTPPLSWKTRIRIAKEICSALIFLHSNEPHIIVHGDLKPSNILLDVNFVSKLGDFGIASFIPRDENSTSTAILDCTNDPKGTPAYVDPDYLATGILTAKADIYSFGVVLLQLLTGRQARWLVKKVEVALDEGTLDAILDASAGDWPLFQTNQLAQMALRCCELNRKHRPNLELEVWKLLQLLDDIQI